jgi:CBS domain-containing protein
MKTFSSIRHPSDDICRSFYGSDARSDQSFSLASGPVYARELERTISLQNRMQVKNIMSQNVEVVRPDSSIAEAAKKMKALDVGALPVSDGDRLVGMITDRDITIEATAQSRDPVTTLVRDCMQPEVIYCFEDQDVEEAERIMQEKQIRRLPVLTREKRLVGIVALGDLATKISQVKEVGTTLREVSHPA